MRKPAVGPWLTVVVDDWFALDAKACLRQLRKTNLNSPCGFQSIERRAKQVIIRFAVCCAMKQQNKTKNKTTTNNNIMTISSKQLKPSIGALSNLANIDD